MSSQSDTHIYTVTLNPGLDRTLTVPSLDFNAVLRATELYLDWGGKGFNVSRALKALGIESVALGFVGGATGEKLAQGLRGQGIPTDFITVDGETRTNTVIREQDSERYIKVNEAGPPVTDAAVEELLEQVARLARPGDYWVLAGSLPPGAPVGVYAQLGAIIQDNGGYVCLDASGVALRLGADAIPFLLKPNREEAAELKGAPVETRSDARQVVDPLLSRGIPWVALSLGAEGLLLANQEQAVHARPPEVRVQTVVGVGDALLAGLLWGFVHDESVETIARYGVAAGTTAAMRAGVGVALLADVEAMARQVQVDIC